MPTISFDKSRCSNGVQFKAALFSVLLLAQTTNSVVFLTDSLFGKRTQLKFEFTTLYGPQAEIVVGIFHVPPHLDDLWLKENPDVSFIDLVSGSLYFRGKKVRQDLPQIKTGAIVTVEFSLTSRSVLTVQNPGEPFVKSSFDIPEINATDLDNVFAGALQTGRKYIQIDLTNDVTANQIPTTESKKDNDVNFDRYQGVIEVSKDGKFLSRNATQQGNGYALLNKLLKRGIHKIKFSVQSDFGASLCIGVARHPFRLSEDYIKDVMKHIYRHPGLMLWRSYRGLLYCDGKQLEKATGALGWQHGGSIVIELVVNMEERTIELLKDDVSSGIIFTDIPEVVQPVVCFYASYEKAVRLISYESTELTPRKMSSITQQRDHLPTPDKVHFDPQGKSGLITLTHNRMTVCREKNQGGNSLCLLNVTCDKNSLHRFSFIIEMDQGASVCVGVTNALNPKDIRINGIGNIFSSPDIYVFRSFQGMLYNKGTELPKHLEEFWMTGSLLEMTIDVNESQATIQYAINGNDQGIAFSGISTPLKPLVAFYAGMEKRVTLIHYEATPRARSVSAEQYDTVYETGTPNRFTRLQSAVQPDGESKESVINYKTFVIDPKIKCENCQDPVDCVALPCGHKHFCAKHLCERGNCPCGIHKHKPFNMWNLLC